MPENYGPFLLAISGVALTSLALCGLCFPAVHFGPDASFRREAAFWLLVAVGSCLMMTFPSRPLWDLLFPLQQVQFPFRFNTVLIVALIALVAGALESYRSLNLPFKRAMAVLGVLMIASWSVPTAFYVAKQGTYVAKQRTAYHRLSDDARLGGFLEQEEYHPRTAGLIVEAYAADRPIEPARGSGSSSVTAMCAWRSGARRIELSLRWHSPARSNSVSSTIPAGRPRRSTDRAAPSCRPRPTTASSVCTCRAMEGRR